MLEALAAVSVASDRPARGAVYLGAADAIRDQIGTQVPACERPMLASTEARGVDMIGPPSTPVASAATARRSIKLSISRATSSSARGP